MTKENQESFIQKELAPVIETLTKRDAYSTQVIEELDKLLNIAKYGSVGHVNKVIKLSTMRNYALRLNEITTAFKEIKDMEALNNVKEYIVNVLKDATTNFKSSSDSLNAVEVFTNEYIKHEILVKTYKELTDLYTEIEGILTKVVEGYNEEPVVEEKPVKKSNPPKKETT